MNPFPAWLARKDDDGYRVERVELNEDDLMDGDVTVRVEYSTLNYKDGLALTGKAPIIRHFPLIPGIDLAGTVLQSESPDFLPGDAVLLNGFGVGESHIPEGLDARRAMAIGTAGYTAMLCILKLEEHGISPDSGPIVLSGAAGGVGSIALAVLARLGYEVHAITGRPEQADYLKSLGAREVLEREAFTRPAKPLARETWQAGIDVAGGNTLANLLSQQSYGGAVAACGLAESMDLPASVAPFILRGVTLYGIDSVQCPMPRRIQAWQRLAKDLDLDLLDLGIDRSFVFTSLIAVVAQRLVRRLCELCREPVAMDQILVDSEEATLQTVDDGSVQCYRAVGCEACNHTGYRGRISISEVMLVNEDFRAEALAGRDSMLNIARAHGMGSMVSDGFHKVCVGETTMDELFRVVME